MSSLPELATGAIILLGIQTLIAGISYVVKRHDKRRKLHEDTRNTIYRDFFDAASTMFYVAQRIQERNYQAATATEKAEVIVDFTKNQNTLTRAHADIRLLGGTEGRLTASAYYEAVVVESNLALVHLGLQVPIGGTEIPIDPAVRLQNYRDHRDAFEEAARKDLGYSNWTISHPLWQNFMDYVAASRKEPEETRD